MIDLLKDADCYCSEETTCSASQVLHTKFKEAYPHISVGRPQRLYDTAKRIAAPTLPSLRGESKLFGLALEEYRSKEWVPRTRNAGPMGMCTDILYLKINHILISQQILSHFLMI